MMKKAILLCTLLTAALFCSCGQIYEPLEENSASQVSAETQTFAEETTASSAEETSTESAKAEETTEPATTIVSETTSVETTVDETSAAETTTAQEDNSKDGIILADGIWLSTYMSQSGVQSQAYYELRSDGTGVKIKLQNGQSEYFEYRTEGMNIILSFQYTGTRTAEVEYIDAYYTLHFDDLTFEDWRYFSAEELGDLVYYTNDELCEMAREYFNASDGRECNYTESEIGDDDEVTIALYEEYNGERDLISVYYIDRYTADGHDWDRAYVDLTEFSQR